MGLGCGERFNFREVAQTLGLVERDFDGMACAVQQVRRARFANRGDGAEPQQLEQVEQLGGGVRTIGKANLDLFACLGGAGPARTFIGDSVLVADRANSKRLVGRGEVAPGWFK